MGTGDESAPPQDSTMKASRMTQNKRKRSNADRRPLLILIAIVVTLLLAILVHAANEALTVTGCSGTTCSVSGLNSDDNLNDGATMGKGATVTTTWSTTTFDAGSTIGDVFLIITHGGASGISGNLNIVLRNTANTVTYCTFPLPNTVASTKETINTTSACSWTKARLDDLVIAITNGVRGKPYNAYLSYTSVNISYLPPDTTPPTVSPGTPANDSWSLTGNQTFTVTPSDNRGLSNCTLFLDGSPAGTNSSPINNTPTQFTASDLSDGSHTWQVNCSDTSNNTGVSTLRTLKVDTTPPNVSLESPGNNTPFSVSEITFFYNASDAQTTLSSCKLIVNGDVKDTKTSPPENTTLNSTRSFSNGQYYWHVNCTDTNGFTASSEERNFTVTIILPFIVMGAGSYPLGQNATLTGNNWDPSVEVTIEYTLSNSTVITHYRNTTSGGLVNDTLVLGYDYPIGTYDVDAYETLTPAKNASTTFDVELPPTTISTDKSSYAQGDGILFTGSDYSPSSTVNITLTFSDASKDSFIAATDSDGDLSIERNLSYTATTGFTNVSATDTAYPSLNATTNFTVTQRVANVTTDKQSYLRSQTVNVTGSNFSRLGNVSVSIYDNTTGTLGPSFPVNESTDDTGAFSSLWNTGTTCNGVYRVEAQDTTHNYLNATAYFTILDLIDSTTIETITSGYNSVTAAAITVSLVNASDTQYETQSSNAGTTWYFELNFTNSLNRGLSITSVTFLIEHYESSGLTNPSLQWWNGTSWNGVSCSFTASGTDHNDTCDLSSILNTPEKLDLVPLRFLLSKSGGGPQNSYLNYATLNISTSYQPACQYFNGTHAGGLQQNPPYITEISLDDAVSSPAGELDLNAGTTNPILCNVTVSDNDGYVNISGVEATLYHSSSSFGAADDNQTHYTNASCGFVSGSGSTANYTCTFNVWYYALNGTWTCTATASDGESSTNNSASATMNALYALNITPTLLDYGDIATGDVSSEMSANVTNIGNVPINVSVRGYGATSGDGFAFACTVQNVTIAAERYALSSVPYGTKTPLASALTDMGLTILATVTGAPSLNTTYWQLQVPTTNNLTGQCNGTIVFEAGAS